MNTLESGSVPRADPAAKQHTVRIEPPPGMKAQWMRDRRLPLANLITMGPATIGLRKIDNRWTVTHEDHSFADTTDTPDHSAAQIRAVHEHWFDRTAAKDLEGP